ncbi:MAG: hypothetical protein Q4G63_04230 [Bacteroidia bacterium]|nr:hypothetical protein [Bacteroidia bacterium]
MALNFENVKNAYKVFNEIQRTVLPELEINSFPEDMGDWTNEERKNPELNRVYGWDRKLDSGWESIVFFVKTPNEELKQKFDELKDNVENSSISGPYFRNNSIWCFGWF